MVTRRAIFHMISFSALVIFIKVNLRQFRTAAMLIFHILWEIISPNMICCLLSIIAWFHYSILNGVSVTPTSEFRASAVLLFIVKKLKVSNVKTTSNGKRFIPNSWESYSGLNCRNGPTAKAWTNSSHTDHVGVLFSFTEVEEAKD